MTGKRPITRIILNARSGDGADDADQATLRTLFTAAGHDVRIDLVHAGDELQRAVERALADGANYIVAAGGDGTVSGVAQHIVDHDVTLGVLPMGTLNHFAKDLAIPLELPAAAQVVIDGATMRVDVGELNGRIFLNNSSLGLYPRIVQLRERYRARGLTKWIVAAWATIRVLRASSAVRLHIAIDGVATERRTPLLFIGNGEYRMEGFDAGSRASVTSGLLSLYTVQVDGGWPLLQLIFRILTGSAQASGELTLVKASAITIHRVGSFRQANVSVAMDGELDTLALPLQYRSRPAALRVCVPPGSPSSR